MVNLIIRSLNRMSAISYFSGRSRLVKTIVLGIFVAAFAALFTMRNAMDIDTTIYPLPPVNLRSTMVDRYVRASGTFLADGAVEVRTRLLGVIDRVMRFIPLMTPGAAEPLMVLDENMPSFRAGTNTVNLVGRILRGDAHEPDLYLSVSTPPSKVPYSVASAISVVLMCGVVLAVLLNSLVRSADYAVTVPQILVDFAAHTQHTAQSPFLLWFGSLGGAYGGVILREIPVSFKAIPAEARIVPVYQRDLWSVIIHRTRSARLMTIATSQGALPAVQLEFEDERGITRKGLVAASDHNVLDSMLSVLRYVGQ
ncbi:MAG: hypothetical protein M1356_08225 [Gammaproteobacteria bacterium]|nr:hypothetical protein [Gammaproteobacteria bacterium]